MHPPADVNFVDDLLPSTFYDVANMFSITCAAIAAITIVNPYILIVVAVFAVACLKLRNFYIVASRKVSLHRVCGGGY